jgi:hypothetical protein
MLRWKISRSPVLLEICKVEAALAPFSIAKQQRDEGVASTLPAVDEAAFGLYSRSSMIKALQTELSINVIASIIVSLLFLAAGFAWGKYKERRRKFGKNLEEYDFRSRSRAKISANSA